jgi:hypothetical protein
MRWSRHLKPLPIVRKVLAARRLARCWCMNGKAAKLSASGSNPTRPPVMPGSLAPGTRAMKHARRQCSWRRQLYL